MCLLLRGDVFYSEMVDSMNEPPGARMRVGLSALTVAEYFREDLQQDVLLFIDNIFRFYKERLDVDAQDKQDKLSWRGYWQELSKWHSLQRPSSLAVGMPDRYGMLPVISYLGARVSQFTLTTSQRPSSLL